MSPSSPDVVPRSSAPLDVTVVSTSRNWAALLILLLVAAVLAALTPFVSGLLGALALYVVVNGLYEWLAHRMRPGVAAGITVLAALVLIIGPLTWLAIVLIDRTPGAVNAALASPLLARLGELQIGDTRIGGQLSSMSGTIITSMSGHFARVVGTATSIVTNLILALSGLYYLLRASNGTWESVREYVPFSARTTDSLRARFIGATQATVLGTGVICVVQGVLVGLGFAITSLPEPVFWGTVAAVAAIVPAIGSTLVWLPGVAVLASQGRYGAAVTLFVFGFGLAGNVDQIIRPLVYRRLSAMHPMITLVGALAGIRYLGIVGLLLGPLAIVYVFELLRLYREEYGLA